MKTKSILAAVLIAAATLSAQAGVRFGISVGVPCPAPVVVVPAAPVVVAAPVCPGPGYVWTPGYWSVCGYSRVWVPGSWLYNHGYCGPGYYRYAYADYAHPYGWHR